ncbi:MAG TPA: hypothetical protein PLU47_15380 [Azonexus sp.]|nr:hypothetical protein [Azonexus sp.]
MLSLRDFIDMCDLTEEEVTAIAEKEKLPAIIAAQIGCAMLRTERGVAYIRDVLKNRAEQAVDRGDMETAALRLRTYEEFRTRCPQAIRD